MARPPKKARVWHILLVIGLLSLTMAVAKNTVPKLGMAHFHALAAERGKNHASRLRQYLPAGDKWVQSVERFASQDAALSRRYLRSVLRFWEACASPDEIEPPPPAWIPPPREITPPDAQRMPQEEGTWPD
jgi:hypothetical protein